MGQKRLSFFYSVGLIASDWCLKYLIFAFYRRKTDNFWFWPERRERSRKTITLSSSTPPVYTIIVFLANLFLVVWLLSLFSGLLPVSRTLQVTWYLKNPHHFVVQLFSYTLKTFSKYYAQFTAYLRTKSAGARKKPVYFLFNIPNFIKAPLIEISRNFEVRGVIAVKSALFSRNSERCYCGQKDDVI